MEFKQNFDNSRMIVSMDDEQLTIQIIQNSYGKEDNAIIILEGKQIEQFIQYLKCGQNNS